MRPLPSSPLLLMRRRNAVSPVPSYGPSHWANRRLLAVGSSTPYSVRSPDPLGNSATLRGSAQRSSTRRGPLSEPQPHVATLKPRETKSNPSKAESLAGSALLCSTERRCGAQRPSPLMSCASICSLVRAMAPSRSSTQLPSVYR